MREILFRGKTTKKEQEIHAFHNVWVEGDLIKNRFKWHIHPKSNCFRSEKELAKCMIAHEVIPETVGQFTGLTDKNGKKIFEGDILKGCWKTIFEVYYDDCLLQFRAKTVDGFNKNIDYYGYPHQIEVIGNIHDNPELLGE